MSHSLGRLSGARIKKGNSNRLRDIENLLMVVRGEEDWERFVKKVKGVRSIIGSYKIVKDTK